MSPERAAQIEAFRRLLADDRLRAGMTRAEVKALLGEPGEQGLASRRYPVPRCYRYGHVQLLFGPRAADGLVMVYSEDETGADGVCLLG